MRQVIALGETIMDILFQHNQPLAAIPGGSSFNSAISLGRTGTPCTFVGYTGDDRVGRQITDFLQSNGVCADYFEMRRGQKSAISLAYLNEHGDADYSFYKDTPYADGSAPLPPIAQDDVLLFGSFYASCQYSRPQVRRMLEEAKKHASIVYYDINFRKSHQHELAELMPTIIENFQYSTIVRGSADDFEVMYHERDARRLYEAHIKPHCDIFICTAGADSLTVCTPSRVIDLPIPPLNTVSTVGAGDNFNAGFCYALLRDGITREQLATLSEEGWLRLLHTGCAFAAEVCQSPHNSISREFAARLSSLGA